MRLTARHLLLFVLALPVAWAASSTQNPAPQGIKNFYQVDPHVYRGAQPDEEGIRYLASIGVKTVVDLRAADERSEAEEKMVAAAGMKYVNIPMAGRTPPTDAQITRILGILESNSGAVFVHCKRGADRTGVVIASYRIDRDGWNNAQALNEAKERGMAPRQLPRMGYIQAFQPRAGSASVTP